MDSGQCNCAETPASCGLFLAAQALIGFGVGVLVADKIPASRRKAAGIAAAGAGAAAAAPLIIEVFTRKLQSAQTSRNLRRRLRSIREGEGFNHEPSI